MMSLFESMKNLIYICQFSGVTLISAAVNTLQWEKNRQLKYFSMVLLILNAVMFISIMFFIHVEWYSYITERIHLFLIQSCMIFSYVTSIVIILESNFQQNKQKRLLELFDMLDTEYKIHLNISLNYNNILKLSKRSISFLCIQVLVFSVLTCVYEIYLELEYGVVFYCLVFLSYITREAIVVYLTFLISLIGENLRTLSTYLENWPEQLDMNLDETTFLENDFNSNNSEIRVNTNENRLDVNRLQFISRSLNFIYESIVLLNQMGFWSLAFEFFIETYILVLDMYHCLIISYHQYYYSCFIFIFSIIKTVWNIGFIVNACENTINNVSLLIY